MTDQTDSGESASSMTTAQTEPAAPREPYLKLFLRFLRFGVLAWGGPTAQIAMIRQELVDEEGWVSAERFNRVLAVYQVLPGPEAHELCVYFGMQARGRVGGLLAGLGFMLPGFVLMLLLSWIYASFGLASAVVAGAFYGMQAAVGALIVRAVHRIGGHVLHDRWLWAIAGFGLLAHFAGVHFGPTLLAAGATYALVKGRRAGPAAVVLGLATWGALAIGVYGLVWGQAAPVAAATTERVDPGLAGLFAAGLRSGLLTFGGAYTVIPFLQYDAVSAGGWMTNAQFLDGLALSGALPAPLVIFGTFVGYLGGGFPGALALTAGIFLPAFGFTLLGHGLMERFIANTALHGFLDGVAAGVVGLIAATTLVLLQASVTSLPALAIFALGLWTLYRWQAKLSVPVVIVAAAAAGLALRALT